MSNTTIQVRYIEDFLINSLTEEEHGLMVRAHFFLLQAVVRFFNPSPVDVPETFG
jgi:hypothetical protein